MAKEITYEVIEECGTIKKKSNGDELKLRYMSWNGNDPKYDLHYWYKDDDGKERCGKGIPGGLTGEEVMVLLGILQKLAEED